MKTKTEITPEEYLGNKGIHFQKAGDELKMHCVFGHCDGDSKEDETHLYMQADTGVYYCQKCSEKGNLVSFARHCGDKLWYDKKRQTYYEVTEKNLPPDKPLAEIVAKCHRELPDRIREYLNQRGITDAVIENRLLGFGFFYKRSWITIPVRDEKGNFVFLKLRQDPNDVSNPDKYKVYPRGVEAQIYQWNTLESATDNLVICEGEFDQIILTTHSIPAITSTAGAGTFKPEWLEKFNSSLKIYICLDNDEAGKKGADKLTKLLSDNGNETHLITLPEELKGKKVKDITDYFLAGGTVEDFFGYAEAGKEEGMITEIEDWQRMISCHFPDLLFPAEVGLSVLAQLKIKDISNPFGLVFVDVPSSGKTIAINFFSEIEGFVYASDNFTPASFVSHATNRPRNELASIDLLPRIRRKMLMVRDLCSIFGERDEDLQKNLSILTRVFDGEGLQTESGVHGRRGYQGDYLFMFLGGSTPISPRVWKAMGNFGSRLFFLNIDSKPKDEDTLCNQLSAIETLRKREKICRTVTRLFAEGIFSRYKDGIEWDRGNDNPELVKIISRTALLLSCLRGTINVWKEGEGWNHTVPIIEKPDRINQLLYNLARGHALICDRQQISEEDIGVILEVAFDSCPVVRSKLFHLLLEKGRELSTDEIMDVLSCSRPTAHKEMGVLSVLGIVETEMESEEEKGGRPPKTICLKKEFEWFSGTEFRRIRKHTQGRFLFLNSQNTEGGE
ncbi:MAG: toprim domain-containing protein [Candidatus Omnitrophota bacterium]